MSRRLKGLSHEEATGVAEEVFAALDRFLGRTSDLVRNLANIKTSMTNACQYCTAHTSIYGQAHRRVGTP